MSASTDNVDIADTALTTADVVSNANDVRTAANIAAALGKNGVSKIPVVGTAASVGLGVANVLAEDPEYRAARAIEQTITVGSGVALTGAGIAVAAAGGTVLLPAAAVAGTAYAISHTGNEAMETYKARDQAEKGLSTLASGDQLRKLEDYGARLRVAAAGHTEELKTAGLLTIGKDGERIYDFGSVEKLEKFKAIVEGKIDNYQPAIDANNTLGRWINPVNYYTNDEVQNQANSARVNQAGEKGNLAVINEIIAFNKEAKDQLQYKNNPTREIAKKEIKENPLPNETKLVEAKSGLRLGDFSLGIGTLMGGALGLLSTFILGPIGIALAAVGAGIGYMFDSSGAKAGDTKAAAGDNAPPKTNHPRNEGGKDEAPIVAPSVPKNPQLASGLRK